MSETFALPDAALAVYLQQHLPGFAGPLLSSKFKGGQSNPTYRLDAASGSYVLRRKPPGLLLKSAHAVDREFRVISALHGRGVPVAQPLHLCLDESVIGSMFYVMELVPGVVHWDPALPKLADARARADHYEALIQTMAALHGLNPAGIGLADYGQPGNYFSRQLGRWTTQYRASVVTPIPAMDALIDWLGAHVPADDGEVALVHGDFRIDNLMFAPDRAEVLAVVDWELSTLGHPLADLAYFCMSLRLPRSGVIMGLGDLDRAALGIPDEAQLIAHYQELRGLPRIDHWEFCLAFNFFRLAAIGQGVYKRAMQGNASSSQALEIGKTVPLLAQMGLGLTHSGTCAS
jgi:aminoglycoside phosphotransferase (APT) family kinase protein